ncbi:MAG: diguanylate cyclase [Gaiella sp.]
MSDVAQGETNEQAIAEVNRLNLAARKALRDDLRAALAAADDAHQNAERAGYAAGRAQALRTIGECRHRLGDREGAQRALEVARHVCAERDDPAGEADALVGLGRLHADAARWTEATELLGRALALAAAAGSRLFEADARHGLSRVLLAAGAAAEAGESLREVIAARRLAGDRRGEALALRDLSTAYEVAGERETASATLDEAIAAYDELGDGRAATRARATQALLLADLGVSEEAGALCGEVAASAKQADELVIGSLCLQCAGALAAWRGDQVAARRAHQEAAGFSRRGGDGEGEARALFRSALARVRDGDAAGAAGELATVSALAGAVGADLLRLDSHRLAATTLEGAGDAAGALAHLRLASSLELELDRRRAQLIAGARFSELRTQMELREAELERLRRIDLAEARTELEQTRAEAVDSVEKARSQQAELERLARIDAATGLANRVWFRQTLEARFGAARDTGQEMALAIVDIDHFRLVNEIARGYRVGDEVIRVVSQLVTEASRDLDLSCRWNGEEFAVLFPRTGRAAAVAACERIRARVAEYDWSSIHPRIRVSVSVGLAGSGEAASPEELVLLAESRAAQAVHEGRNQVSW